MRQITIPLKTDVPITLKFSHKASVIFKNVGDAPIWISRPNASRVTADTNSEMFLDNGESKSLENIDSELMTFVSNSLNGGMEITESLNFDEK